MGHDTKNSHVFLILSIAEEKLFDFGVEGGEPLFLLGVREVDAHVSSWRDNVELGVEHINAVNDSVESGKSESSVTLVLTYSVLAEKGRNEKKIGLIFKKKKQRRKRNNRTERSVRFINLPAISWKVLVIMKSVWFMAIRSAVNWHEKWYFSSNFFQ